MAKRTWTFDLDGRRHIVELNHGVFSTKRVITVDGATVVSNGKLLEFVSEHTFPLGKHRCTIRIRPNIGNWLAWVFMGRRDGPMTYECVIDGSTDRDSMSQKEDPLREASRMIREGRTAGILVGGVTLFMVLLNVLTGSSYLGLTSLNLIDVAIMGFLTFGVHRRNRASAVILFAYFVTNELLRMLGGTIVGDDAMGRTIFAGAFGLFLFQGIRGTFAYHRLTKLA